MNAGGFGDGGLAEEKHKITHEYIHDAKDFHFGDFALDLENVVYFS